MKSRPNVPGIDPPFYGEKKWWSGRPFRRCPWRAGESWEMGERGEREQKEGERRNLSIKFLSARWWRWYSSSSPAPLLTFIPPSVHHCFERGRGAQEHFPPLSPPTPTAPRSQGKARSTYGRRRRACAGRPHCKQLFRTSESERARVPALLLSSQLAADGDEGEDGAAGQR